MWMMEKAGRYEVGEKMRVFKMIKWMRKRMVILNMKRRICILK